MYDASVSCIRQIEAVDVRVIHHKILSDRVQITFCLSHVMFLKTKMNLETPWYYIIIIGECKIINFFKQC